ncbi:MAG: inositol monophosphatase family protein [Burkholderiales bacterium]
MHPMLSIAVKAARRAGSIINRASQDLDRLKVRTKGYKDYVSEVDTAAERAVLEVLNESFPSHAILAEESGAQGESEYQWIIDPLDGTTNFLHGFPQYAVSIALAQRGVLTQAVVYDPTRNDLFTATRGGGAFLNDRRIRVSKRERLDDALLGTGFPFRDSTHLNAYLAMFRSMLGKAKELRRAGAASLDLAYTAAGRLDGFWEIGLKAWDMAAGALLVQEAGGLVGDFSGNEGFLQSGHIIAAPPKIFNQLIHALAPHLTDALKT